jgi:hypothetical protein
LGVLGGTGTGIACGQTRARKPAGAGFKIRQPNPFNPGLFELQPDKSAEILRVIGYGNAPFPSFSRSVSTDYRLLTKNVKRFVRTDKLFSLHSFITVTWFVVQA